MALVKPKEITVTDIDGVEKTVILSRFPAVEGREIVSQWPISALPKIGDYHTNEATMLKMLCYVGVPHPEKADAPPTLLTTRALVNAHLNDWEALAKVEKAMLSYNTSFFSNGVASTFFGDLLLNTKAWATSTLTDLLDALLKAAKQR